MKKVILYWHKNHKVAENRVLSEVLVGLGNMTTDELKLLKKDLETFDGGLLLRIDKKAMLNNVKEIIKKRNYYARKWCEERFKI